MNLPNRLTLIRMILIPIIIGMWIFPYVQFGPGSSGIQIASIDIPLKNVLCLVVFTIASITDFLDGAIARATHQITTFGKFMDPIADKCLTSTLFILFVSSSIIPVVPVLVMIMRDIIVDAIRFMAAGKNKVIAAGRMGKLKTVAQMVCIILILLNNFPFALISIPMADIMLWFATAVSVLSGFDYFKQGKESILETK